MERNDHDSWYKEKYWTLTWIIMSDNINMKRKRAYSTKIRRQLTRLITVDSFDCDLILLILFSLVWLAQSHNQIKKNNHLIFICHTYIIIYYSSSKLIFCFIPVVIIKRIVKVTQNNNDLVFKFLLKFRRMFSWSMNGSRSYSFIHWIPMTMINSCLFCFVFSYCQLIQIG